jgi:hypothetical protein
MKSFVRVTVGGILLAIPAMSLASAITFDGPASQNTAMFNPQGSGSGNTYEPIYYRSYDCRIGGKHVTIPAVIVPKITPPVVPPPNNDNPPPSGGNPPPSGGNPPPPGGSTDSDPVLPVIPLIAPPPPPDNPGPSSAAVPLPAPSEMAGAGLAVTTVLSWLRSRRQARRSA